MFNIKNEGVISVCNVYYLVKNVNGKESKEI